MNTAYKIYPDLNFGVIKVQPGLRSFDELANIIKSIRDDKDFDKVDFQLTDLRGCIFDFDRSKLNDLAQLVNNYNHHNDPLIGVYIVDKPLGTAYAQLFFSLINKRREICITPEKAYRILNLSISLEEFKEKLDIIPNAIYTN